MWNGTQNSNGTLAKAYRRIRHQRWPPTKSNALKKRPMPIGTRSTTFTKINSSKIATGSYCPTLLVSPDSWFHSELFHSKCTYSIHRLFTEFPELKSASRNTPDHFNILEIGCGVGNTILPILKYNIDANLRVFGCDFSSRAIDILRAHDEFDAERCRTFVLDATNERWTDSVPFNENSMDIIVLIFVLSAIKPEK